MSFVANNPLTTQLLIRLGLNIIRETGDSEDGLKAWYNDLATPACMWDTLKIHFQNTNSGILATMFSH